MPGPTAIILAAGKGDRLAPLTDQTNKVLIDVGGRSILRRLLDGLANSGVANAVIVTGHCADSVERDIGSHHRGLSIRYVHNPDFATTNNIVSLALALASVPDAIPLLLIEGDLVLDPALIRRMVERTGSDAALVDRFRPGLDGTLATVSAGAITELAMGERLAALTERFDRFKTVNVTALSAATLDTQVRPMLAEWLKRGRTDDYYEAVFAELLEQRRIAMGAVIVDGEPWAEIDDAQDLDRARYLFALEGRRAVLDAAFGGYWNYPVLDYAFPRNVYFPTPAIHGELAALLPTLLGAYGSTQQILDQKLARYLRCPADQVVLLNGLSQIFPWLSAKLGGAAALIPRPGFGEYARVWPGAATYGDTGNLDMRTVQRAATGADVVVFVNPNNPTGTAVPSEAIVAFADAHPGKTVVVDESFADFSSQPCLSATAGAALPANVLVLKSLGKSHGVPGLRLGYARSSNRDLIAGLRATLPVWNCNALAEAFLELLPKHRRAHAAALDQTRRDRADMRAALERLPIVAEILPSEANFLLIRLALDVDRLPALLDFLVERHGIYIKDISARIDPPGAWVRLSVRAGADNARLYAAFDDWPQAASHRPAEISPATHA